jgi:hypothetical protein
MSVLIEYQLANSAPVYGSSADPPWESGSSCTLTRKPTQKYMEEHGVAREAE